MSTQSGSTDFRRKDVTLEEVLKRLRQEGDPKHALALEKLGVKPRASYGVPPVKMKKIVAEIGRDHRLAQELWGTGLYDARLLASLIDEPEKVTKVQMDRWARQFDSQAICDNCCFNLFHATQFSWGRCVVWTDRKEEFVKKAGFTLMGALADFEMKADDTQFHRFIPIIERCGNDDRLFVKKAAAYALGAIGRRSPALKKMCAETADRMAENASKAAQFVGKEAQKEMAKPRPKAS
jgi:3-methyladenine DNA glycosylase AlkD